MFHIATVANNAIVAVFYTHLVGIFIVTIEIGKAHGAVSNPCPSGFSPKPAKGKAHLACKKLVFHFTCLLNY